MKGHSSCMTKCAASNMYNCIILYICKPSLECFMTHLSRAFWVQLNVERPFCVGTVSGIQVFPFQSIQHLLLLWAPPHPCSAWWSGNWLCGWLHLHCAGSFCSAEAISFPAVQIGGDFWRSRSCSTCGAP